MSIDASPRRHPPGRRPWWSEAEAGCLLLLVLAAYFLRAGELPLRGEEPTRAQIAFEMIERHDWLVPREQGDPFLIRPPLQNWLIAASSLAFGSRDAWAVRFPSLVATLLTTLMVYGYSRTFLPRTGALAAGAAFATFGEMFQTGRQAETEAVFILLVSGSLLAWHWGFMRRWPDAATWALGYGLTALGALTKGVQAPAYFVGSVGVYLALTNQGRRLFCKGHVLGALAGAAVVGAWMVPYYFAMGWPALHTLWLGDPALRVRDWPLLGVAKHLLEYPLETLGGTLPWSLLLLLYLSGDFRRSIRAAGPQVLFLGVCLAVTFPTCWIPPGGQARFFAPLYPCLAVLIGLAVQRCSEAGAATALRSAWRQYLGALAGGMVLAAVAAVGVACGRGRFPALGAWAEPPLIALGYAGVAVGLAALAWRARRGGDPFRVRMGVLAVACFLVLTFTGVATDVRLHRSEDASGAMSRLKEKLPPGQPLVSLGGHTDSLFTYLYGLPLLTPRPWPADGNALGEGVAYFCFACDGDSRPMLPFAWEEVGAVCVDRNHHPSPQRVVVVGRRLPVTSDPAAAK